MSQDTSFSLFAEDYNKQMGEQGDFTHKLSIDPAFMSMIGDVKGLNIYDFGCGNGYFVKKISLSNPNIIYASDISEKLIEIAGKHNTRNIKFFVANGCDSSYFEPSIHGTFDVIMSNMAVHYVHDFQLLIKNVSKLLKVGGRFIFTAAHPIDDIMYAIKKGNPDEVLKKSLLPYQHEISWKGNKLLINKRPMSYYVIESVNEGFLLNKMVEMPKIIPNENGEFENTGKPAYFGMSFIKMK